MSDELTAQSLGEITFLKGLCPETLDKILSISQRKQIKKNAVLFDEGQKADKLYLIVSGSVMLQACSEMTGCKPILTVSKGELLGWSSLTDKQEYAARALALEPLEVVEIDGAKLRAICDQDPRFGYEFLRRTMIALSKRLHVTWKQVAEVCVADYLPLCATAQND
jgi:CRP-like cAMP-binding protein